MTRTAFAQSLIFACCLFTHPIARAQPTPSSDVDVLKGPTVSPANQTGTDERKSLVSRDFDGKLRPLETTQEEAALELLTLSPSERSNVQAILTKRAAAMDRVIGDNIELLLRLKTARESGNQSELREATAEMIRQLAPVRKDGPLADQLAAALEPENAKSFQSLTKEYWEAILTDEMAKTQKSRQGSAMGLRLKLMGQEIARAYETRIGGLQEDLEDLITRLELTPEQGEKVRQISLDFAQKTLGKPTPAQQREVYVKVNRLLTPAQQEKLLREFYSKRQTSEAKLKSGNPEENDPKNREPDPDMK